MFNGCFSVDNTVVGSASLATPSPLPPLAHTASRISSAAFGAGVVSSPITSVVPVSRLLTPAHRRTLAHFHTSSAIFGAGIVTDGEIALSKTSKPKVLSTVTPSATPLRAVTRVAFPAAGAGGISEVSITSVRPSKLKTRSARPALLATGAGVVPDAPVAVSKPLRSRTALRVVAHSAFLAPIGVSPGAGAGAGIASDKSIVSSASSRPPSRIFEKSAASARITPDVPTKLSRKGPRVHPSARSSASSSRYVVPGPKRPITPSGIRPTSGKKTVIHKANLKVEDETILKRIFRDVEEKKEGAQERKTKALQTWNAEIEKAKPKGFVRCQLVLRDNVLCFVCNR